MIKSSFIYVFTACLGRDCCIPEQALANSYPFQMKQLTCVGAETNHIIIQDRIRVILIVYSIVFSHTLIHFVGIDVRLAFQSRPFVVDVTKLNVNNDGTHDTLSICFIKMVSTLRATAIRKKNHRLTSAHLFGSAGGAVPSRLPYLFVLPTREKRFPFQCAYFASNRLYVLFGYYCEISHKPAGFLAFLDNYHFVSDPSLLPLSLRWSQRRRFDLCRASISCPGKCQQFASTEGFVAYER